MDVDLHIIKDFKWDDFSDECLFKDWSEAKKRAQNLLSESPEIEMDSVDTCDDQALSELKSRCAISNFALYRVAEIEKDLERNCAALATFSRNLGFTMDESHRSAGEWGVVALRPSSEPAQRGYIPYSKRPLNWHTDGYYNSGSLPVKAFILHCHQQAESGGLNQLADPEMAYLRLRAENPDYVRALMHPEAMTIPENREADGTLRPVSVGPVFFADEASGRLQMRFTARTRSIVWRDDATTRQAVDCLGEWLNSDDPSILSLRLAPGQGIVSNNALHNRTGFDTHTTGNRSARVMLRVRFHERLAENEHGAA